MNLDNINLAVAGAGRWGFNHVKTANNLLNANNLFVFDPDLVASKRVRDLNSEITIISSFEELLDNPKINSVVISAPAETHYKLTKQCLEAGKNVLVEKPIALHLKEAEELNKIADENCLKLMVGHVLLYHPAILKIREDLLHGKIGKLQYIYSNRLNLGAIRSEENILWSFAPHDIAIIQYLIEKKPIDIKAMGASFLQHQIEDTTLTYLEYPDGIRAHIHVSWLHPFKEQRLVVIGEKGMFVFEDAHDKDKLKYYNKGYTEHNGHLEKFDNDFEIIPFENKMPLEEEHIHFYDSILNDFSPRTNGKHAVEVLEILETATEKLKLEHR